MWTFFPHTHIQKKKIIVELVPLDPSIHGRDPPSGKIPEAMSLIVHESSHSPQSTHHLTLRINTVHFDLHSILFQY